MPTHVDNQSIVKERFFFDPTDPKLLHDEITLIDHAFTRPWTVLKTYRRSAAKFPIWTEQSCPEISVLVDIGGQIYFKGADGTLLPTRKDQPPPDLRYFKQSRTVSALGRAPIGARGAFDQSVMASTSAVGTCRLGSWSSKRGSAPCPEPGEVP